MDFITRIIKESRELLRENDEASKNLAVESLKQISETLDLLRSNVDMALSKMDIISGMDNAKTKLRGMASIIDANTTEVAEIIADMTGLPTGEHPLDEDVEMTSDDAIKNIDKVKKLTQNDVQVVIDDTKRPNM